MKITNLSKKNRLLLNILICILIINVVSCSIIKTENQSQQAEIEARNEDVSTELSLEKDEVSSNSSNDEINQLEDEPVNQIEESLPASYLGHFPYEESSADELVNMGKYYYRTEYLHRETAEAFNKMKAGAKAEGIELVLMSGFRGVEKQEELFNKQIQKRGSKEAAAKLSAPAGYSEHHTGYALDIGDGKEPEKDFKFEFESTQAYQWLIQNREKYGFELSFPKDNIQGVSFEPWHWRYIGSTQAMEIFASTKNAELTP